MRGKLGIALIAVVLGSCAFLATGKASEAQAQRAKTDNQAFEYKVIVLTYNPGERLNDEQRVTQFDKDAQHRGQGRLGTRDLAAQPRRCADHRRRRDDS